MIMIKNPYLTIINSTTKFNPADFKEFEYDKVPVAMGDWGKKTAVIEKQTHLAYKQAVKELEEIGAVCTLNSAGRSVFDNVYAKIEKFGSVLKNSKSIVEAASQTKHTTAKLGYSEHQSALAIDMSINMDKATIPNKIRERYPYIDREKLNYITARLFMEKHGFILSYPNDSRLFEVTGIKKSEKWHWRYVGPEHSQRIGKIREKVNADLKSDYEVFLEDYVSLLEDYEIKADSEESLIDHYAELFKVEMLDITTIDTEDVSL